MTHPSVNIFVQARMSSSRFPGKMLADIAGKPLLDHVVSRLKEVPNISRLVVLTSDDPSDDKIAQHCESQKYDYFRGALFNVFQRFSDALKVYPCDYFIRISGDSPLISAGLVEFCISETLSGDHGFCSNVRPRTFPKGQSVEILRAEYMRNISADALSDEDKEHVMPYFYRNVKKYHPLFIQNNVNESETNLCIDLPEDLERIENNMSPYIFKQDNACLKTD